MSLAPGTRFGVFQLTALIGRGGMGEVYRATDTKLKPQVAIKIDPEHLVALAFQAGGHKRRERAWQMIEVGAVNRQRLRELLSAHGIMMEIDDGP